MSSQRYERVAANDDDLAIGSNDLHNQDRVPNSPPPSFRSHTSSRRSSVQHNRPDSEVERSLDDAFGGAHDSEDDDDENEESRRLVSRSNSVAQPPRGAAMPRRNTELPRITPTAQSSRVYGGGSSTRDGVFANISAKPQAGEDLEEKPPTYEQAAADNAPPYWETTILTPGGYTSDDIFVDGLTVGSMFSFVWNALISMSFQLIGFLLTYLLHTTHAAKHGSRAGLGITLIQFGFTFRKLPASGPGFSGHDPNDHTSGGAIPPDPNAHDFDPSQVSADQGGSAGGFMGNSGSDWFSYVLMIAGWFILIKASSDFFRARRQEMLIRNSENRGLPVPIVAEGEGERAV